MRELCIACNKHNVHMLMDLHKYLTTTNNQIITDFADEHYNYILFADTTNFNCVFQLKNAFLHYFINEFKYNYILQKISQRKDFLLLASVKVLALFDRETDEQFLLTDLMLSGRMYLDSYTEFRLSLLKKRWQEIVDLALDNHFCELSLADRGEILAFLVSTMTTTAHIGHLTYDNGQYTFRHDEHEAKFDSDARLELVTYILRVCPARLQLSTGLDKEIETFLHQCFGARIIK